MNSSSHDDAALDFVKNQSIFTDLSHQELEYVAHSLQLHEYAPGEYIIHENDRSQDIYLIKSGQAEVVKRNQHTHQDFVINTLQEGDIIGEMAFIDGQPRSSSVRVINQPAYVYKLPVEKESHSSLSVIYDKILEKITQSSLTRLRATNQNYTCNLKKQIAEVEKQNSFGYFFIFFITMFNLVSIAERFLLVYPVSESSWLSLLIYSLLLLIPTACFMRYVHYPFSDFGMSTQNIMSTLKSTSMLAIGGILLGGCAYYFMDRSLFYTHVSYAYHHFFSWKVCAIFLYAFSSEFAVRGAIQTSLQKFLFPHNQARAVWINAFLLWPSDLYLGFDNSFIDFLMNLVLGTLFLKQQNLAGVVLIRFMVLIFTQYG